MSREQKVAGTGWRLVQFGHFINITKFTVVVIKYKFYLFFNLIQYVLNDDV